jgi:hypothetical protein
MALDSMTSFPANGLQHQKLYAYELPGWIGPMPIARAANALGPGFCAELVLLRW